MKRIITAVLLSCIAAVTSGCATNYYNVPRETFEKKVRVLGVAPVLLDPESDIRHPEKEKLLPILQEFNKKNDRELVAQCKSSGTFYLVQPLSVDPDQLFASLFFRRERRDDAGIVYNKYFFKGPELKQLIEQNKVDALLVVVMSGLTKHGRRYSSNLMHYLETDYNNLILTAQIIDSEGSVLWEYPNFRQRNLSFPTFLALQYPAFDEAEANESAKVDVHFKTIDGIRRSLAKAQKSSVLPNAAVSRLYADAFDEMVSLLKPEKNLLDFKQNKKNSDKEGAEQRQQETK
ncbi:hypothetical protein [Geobacter sp. DSM 9736]|uniref:hypothetical protein n=1 Tax=Geobacter sp. DSM 9736 TaxID=1277350 RepID=UPI000B504E97|nr:hypothetical protein [Geobacter sp. DSM 9736]SNB47758.1 hypothetical protein SAMN06269301_3250 [Geobacter sp. DSM 9736]